MGDSISGNSRNVFITRSLSSVLSLTYFRAFLPVRSCSLCFRSELLRFIIDILTVITIFVVSNFPTYKCNTRQTRGRGLKPPAMRVCRVFALVGRLEILLTAGGFFHPLLSGAVYFFIRDLLLF